MKQVVWTTTALFLHLVHMRSGEKVTKLHGDEMLVNFDLWDDGDIGNNEDGGEILVLEITIGYITGASRKPGNLEYSRPGHTISGALTYALNELKRKRFFSWGERNKRGQRNEDGGRKRRLRLRFKLIVAETFGNEEESIRKVASLWKDSNVSVILGPQETCLHEAKLATSLNIPMISYFCSDEETSDKFEFATFSRTRPPDAAISRAIASLVLKYGWTSSLVLIYSDSADDPRYKRGAKSLSILFKAKGVHVSETIPYRGPYHHGYGENPFEPIVTSTKSTTRLYIIISQYYEHLGLILALQKHKLLENGEYLVIGVAMDDYKEDEWNPRRYFRGLIHEFTEADTPSAFRSYLGIIASPPKNYTEFSRQVNRYMELPPFDWPNPLARLGGMKKIRIEAAYLYDSVFLYANALREIITETLWNPETGDKSSQELSRLIQTRAQNGILISQKFRNVSFKSATGLDSEMDENGDAVGNFTLLTLKRKEGEFGLYPVGYFVRHSELPELALRESIDWIGGAPPVSEPECGFYDEKCQGDSLSMIAVGVVLSLLLFAGSAGYLIFRHWTMSRAMDRLMWRIDKRDIEVTNSGGGKSLTRTGSQSSLARFSTVYAPLVTYRGRIFAAKKLDMDLLVLDTPLKQQLKLLREIRHENLNAFIGASELDEGLMLVSEYCSRGSIKDILDNGDLKLDDMFISSLVGDLLRGLSYLHDSSAFRFHGNLKTSNCLVTSQWVLKLSDFGLVNVSALTKRLSDTGGDLQSTRRSQGRVSFTMSHHHQNSNTLGQARKPLLSGSSQSPYLPPEIGKLWNNEVKNVVESYRKVDIYSLGVILWELLKRESLGSFLRLKSDGEIRTEIMGREPGRFWTRALRSLLDDVQGSERRLDTSVSCASTPQRENMVLSQSLSGHQSSKLTNNQSGSVCNFNGSCSAFGPMANNSSSGGHVTLPVPQAAVAGQVNPSIQMLAQVVDTLESCLQFDPELRPDLKSVRIKLRPLHKGMKSNIFDTMIALMEKYANNLERLVDERTKQLSEEKRKAESLLYEMIPASVAKELKEGLRVPAESFEMVSVYFSDIVSFTSIAAASDPIQVVEFLNDLYTCFDAVIENFQVYKVETIGDAYMVASGLPVAQEGNFHALEMARMALCLLQTVTNFRIRHRPQEILNLRIGLHSGPVCAGVVGRKRPRYCLFGDTVNTASRMESTGLSRRIHCSEAFARLVEDHFELERRGLVDVKGKGDMTTYWLIAEKNLGLTNSWSRNLMTAGSIDC